MREALRCAACRTSRRSTSAWPGRRTRASSPPPRGSASSLISSGRRRAGGRRRAASSCAPSASACGRAPPGVRWPPASTASRRATSASHTPPSATVRTCASPGARTCGCSSCARAGGAPAWPRTYSASRWTRRPGAATRRSGSTRPRARPARAASTRARVGSRPGAPSRSRSWASTSWSTAARSVDPIPLLEEATERSRVSMRTRWRRVRVAWRLMFQAGVAVALAWGLSKAIWGHTAPFFAPVAAIIALGQSYHQRGRRALELVIGVSLGIGVADVLASQLGTGVPQLALAVFLAIGIGLFFGSSPLFVNQVAVSTVLVFTIQPPANGITFARSLDALTGGVVALAVAALVLPADPLRLIRDAARPVLDELAETLTAVRAALMARDPQAAAAALERARGIDELGARFSEAAGEGRETVRFSPARRRARSTVEFYAEAAMRIDLAIRNVRVLARGAIRALGLDDNVPPEVGESIDELAAAVRALARALDTDAGLAEVRDHAGRAAALATRVLAGTTHLSGSGIVGQVRSTATDLMAGTGLSYEAAASAVREAVREG